MLSSHLLPIIPHGTLLQGLPSSHIHSSSIPLCSISLILYYVVRYLQAKNHQLPIYVLIISKTGHFIFLGDFQAKPSQIPCMSYLLGNIQTSYGGQPASSPVDTELNEIGKLSSLAGS